MVTLLDLPNEILQQILGNVPVLSLVACASSCRRLYSTAGRTIWRHRCFQDFCHWDYRHNISVLSQKPIEEVDWKALYIARFRANIITQRSLNSTLACQAGRLDIVHSLIQLGDDIKDVLLANLAFQENAPDVLARRWYSRAIIGRLQREQAIQTWSEFADGHPIPLVKALHAFDVFVMRERVLEYSQVCGILDTLAADIQRCLPNWDELSTRQKAKSIARYLLSHQLVGLKSGHQHLDVRNSFIGYALSHEEHPSLQLISTVIYCAVAERLGLTAKPCGFPRHVLAIVFASGSTDLDGNPMLASQMSPEKYGPQLIILAENRLYLDPFQSAEEKSLNDLLDSLRQIGVTGDAAVSAMNASPDSETVLRCGRNIINAVQESFPQESPVDALDVDPQAALYAALWCFLILSGTEPGNDTQTTLARRRAFLPHLVERFTHHYPFDAHLMLDIVCPLFDAASDRVILRNHIRDVIGKDSFPPEPKVRSEQSDRRVKFRIGQLFRHAKYHYQGLVYGWDDKCEASEDWIQRMRIPDLERGRSQSFYHILGDDGSTRYVAEDNIEPIYPSDPPPVILDMAGQYFKRWDRMTKMFVSNIRDEYPND